MYVPQHFEEPRTETLRELMRARPLATLVSLAPAGLDANHIPLYWSAQPAPFGTLRGHVARANPLWRDGGEVLAIFHGPDAYVTPSWYPTKVETGKAVPTWNYAVAHAHGSLRAIEDPVWLRRHLEDATARNEARFAPPWRLDEAPPDYIEALMGAVVGIEIVIDRLVGKWKLSQNQPSQNRAGVVQGLCATGAAADADMAALVEAAGKPR